MRRIKLLALILVCTLSVFAQKQRLTLRKQTFELHNMTGSIIKFEGKDVLKIERDLKALPFDVNNIEATVDEPHYARLVGLEDFENGTIEVKMYSRFKIHRRIQALQDSSAYISELKKTTPPLTEFM